MDYVIMPGYLGPAGIRPETCELRNCHISPESLHIHHFHHVALLPYPLCPVFWYKHAIEGVSDCDDVCTVRVVKNCCRGNAAITLRDADFISSCVGRCRFAIMTMRKCSFASSKVYIWSNRRSKHTHSSKGYIVGIHGGM